ncbi:hypothetical protein B0H13DRAFT_2315347 [Mycena leptocephala]|nr:hypothetical protein B0H13DRAFT_2315347 [Mycena leptocephala]
MKAAGYRYIKDAVTNLLLMKARPHFNMANSAAILSTSLPLNRKLKPVLQANARALGITNNATVPSLRKSINEHIRNHAEIADDPRFLPLLASSCSSQWTYNRHQKQCRQGR